MTRWQVFGAVALRKLPELRPQLDIIESKVQRVFSALELANSRYSQHEMQHAEEIRLKESESEEVLLKETAQDKEDRWMKAKSEFTFGKHDDRLTRTQYLFVKQKFGTDIKDQWLLPQAIYDSQQDENLMDTARRALKDTLNIVNGFRIVSKVPSSVCSFKYPKKVIKMTGFDGAHVFFLKAHLDFPSESVLAAVNSETNDRLSWLTADEAFNVVDKDYLRSLSSGLLSEKRVNPSSVLARAAKYISESQAKNQKLQQASQI